MPKAELYWLLPDPERKQALAALGDARDANAWARLVRLANSRLDFVRTMQLDAHYMRLFGSAPPPGLATSPVRLAILGSSTTDHLHAGIRIGGLRRGIWVATWQSDYGQYRQELADPGSSLHQWAPTTVLFALDARHLLQGFPVAGSRDAIEHQLNVLVDDLIRQWRLARDRLGARVIQQVALPVFPLLAGNNEHRFAGSPAHLVMHLNQRLRERADEEGVDVMSVDRYAAAHGLEAWYDPVLWHRAKQEIHPTISPFYGDLVGRLLAAQQGRSFKCLVLDLDNTLWGGVIGNDGLDGIVLGQGSAAGEAFLAFQSFARDLAERGVLLAICAECDEEIALEPFDHHPDMLLRRCDIACFSTGWQDKPSAIREVAEKLQIGLDCMVVVDDDPFDRDVVRRELPMVAVPELPDDPALYPAALADAGYFEATLATAEEPGRESQHRTNRSSEPVQIPGTDLEGYLRSLDMELRWRRFDRVGHRRIMQLINKTNQFNLTARHYSDEEIAAVTDDPQALSLQIRLLDRFGDNGIISLVIGRFAPSGDTMEIDTWLMSCRVLGRQVEEATISLVVAEAKRLGANSLIGRYVPTEKNEMVKHHYKKLGFSVVEPDDARGDTLWRLDLARFDPKPVCMRVVEV